MWDKSSDFEVVCVLSVGRGDLMDLRYCRHCPHVVQVALSHGCHTLACSLDNDRWVRDMGRCPLLPPPVIEVDLTYVVLGGAVDG